MRFENEIRAIAVGHHPWVTFRQEMVATLPLVPLIYVLLDLFGLPLYVGLMKKGKARVHGHLVSFNTHLHTCQEVNFREISAVRIFIAAHSDELYLRWLEYEIWKQIISEHGEESLVNEVARPHGKQVAVKIPAYEDVRIMCDEQLMERSNPLVLRDLQRRHLDEMEDLLNEGKDSDEFKLAYLIHNKRYQRTLALLNRE